MVLPSLKRINDVVHSINEGNECGMKLTENLNWNPRYFESWKEERSPYRYLEES